MTTGSNTTRSPKPRPESLDALAFDRQGPVHWFSPSVLARAGAKVVLSATFGDYLDKRELQGAIDCELYDDHQGADDLWVDVISDTGDGFDPTYTVAWCASQRELTSDKSDGAAGSPLPRGSYLVFGGDEVYPVASTEDYENRFVGPHSAALPWTEGEDPQLLAIPGNHDWYDGLTSFMRIFGQGRHFGGRSTTQTRSYFAIALPHGHWFWAIDVQDGSYLDLAQIEYFRDAASKMTDGDRLILCTSEPTWAHDEPGAYDNIHWVERKLVPERVETVLMISGDSHHYAHYASSDGARAKLTAGGGGAFLSATSHLPDEVEVPIALDRDKTETFRLTPTEASPSASGGTGRGATGVYPTKKQSTAMSVRVLGLGYRNPWFMLVPAILSLVLFASNVSGLRTDDRAFGEVAPEWGWLDLATGQFRSPFTIVTMLVLVLLLALFYDMPKGAPAWRTAVERVSVGVVHTAGLLLLIGAIALAGIELLDGVDEPWTAFAVALFVFVVGGVAGSVAFGLYLWIAFAFRRHDNEVFSSFRSEDYKNFLRLHITNAGVEVFPIGIDKCNHDWGVVDAGNTDREASHIRPGDGTIRTRLIESPFMVLGSRPRPPSDR